MRLDRFNALQFHTRLSPILSTFTKTVSDHNPLLISTNLIRAREVIPTWNLQLDLLADPVFRESLWAEVENDVLANWESVASRLREWEASKVVVRGHCISASAGVLPVLLREVEAQEEIIRTLEQRTPTDALLIPELLEERGRWAELMERLWV